METQIVETDVGILDDDKHHLPCGKIYYQKGGQADVTCTKCGVQGHGHISCAALPEQRYFLIRNRQQLLEGKPPVVPFSSVTPKEELARVLGPTWETDFIVMRRPRPPLSNWDAVAQKNKTEEQ